MPVQFHIDKIFPIIGQGYFVSARHLSPEQEFSVTEKSFLGGVELEKFFDIPRKLDEHGKQVYHYYVFQFKRAEDHQLLKEDTVVELVPGDGLHCLVPWHFTNTDLTVQLKRELHPGHLLFGKKVKTIARRQDNDDVLFEVEDAPLKYAMVHLTWATKMLRDGNFPSTKTYKDWRDVYENRIIVDNQGWDED